MKGDPGLRRERPHQRRSSTVVSEGDVDLCLADTEEEMPDEELARLNEALSRGFESIKASRFRPAADVIADLRRS